MKLQSSTTILTGLSLFTGAVIGIGTGMLLAPQSGERTRRKIKDLVEDAGEQLEEKSTVATRSMNRMLNRTKAYCRLQRRNRLFKDFRFQSGWLNHRSDRRIPLLSRFS